MLCIFLERCFESLVCCLDLWLSSLLVAFIFMCFSPLRNFFSTSLIASRQNLDRYLFYRDFWVDLDSFLTNRSIHRAKIYCSLSARHILNRFSIHRGWLLLDSSLKASRSVETLLHALFFTCFYSFLCPLSIMTKRERKCGFFSRFDMLGGEIHAFVRGSCVSSC